MPLPHHFVSIQWPWRAMAAASIGLLASWLTVLHGLPYGHDSIRHLYWLVERDYLIRHGIFYTRWSPFLGYGYGYPLYNYYPPLLYYLAEPFMLVGWGPLVALRITLGFALVGAALGIYFWVKELFGSGPGVVAAMAYLFSPYIMYTLVNRGGFPEILALAWLPWGLWSMRRFADQQQMRDGIFIALSIAAALLTHLLTGYITVATLVIYGSTLCLLLSKSGWRSIYGLRLIWPLGLGLGLAAFFWLPAMLESNLITIERLRRLGDPTKGEGLWPFWEIFAGQVLPDPFSPVATIAPRLSWLAAGLGALGAITGLLALHSTILKLHLLVALSVTLVTVFMLTPAAQPLWQHLPMLYLLQFPFRLLALANIWVALLVGAGTSALLALIHPSSPWRRWAEASMVLMLCLFLGWYTLHWPAVAYHASNMASDLKAALQFERVSGQMGLMPANECLPLTVKEVPPSITGPFPGTERLNLAAVPDSAHLLASEYGLLNYRIIVDTPQASQVVFKTFYFPGWWAQINGKSVLITPTKPYGLISLDVPAGKHQIEIGFGTTPIRVVANGLSCLSLMGLLALLVKTTK